MASIINGYEYDIFISYRHNDNRSGRVTESAREGTRNILASV